MKLIFRLFAGDNLPTFWDLAFGVFLAGGSNDRNLREIRVIDLHKIEDESFELLSHWELQLDE